MWGLLTAVDSSFGCDQYRKLGTPDMRLLHWDGMKGLLDLQFRFSEPPVGCTDDAAKELETR